jgi:Tol biopolymer transport system component
MIPTTVRISVCAAAGLLLLSGCEGRVNDDANFFVLTTRSSTDAVNSQGNGPSLNPALTPDGRFLVFESRAANLVPLDTNIRSDVFRKDLATGQTVLVSVDPTGVQGNGNSHKPVVTSDGRLIAFESDSDNLVVGDNNDARDIYVRDVVSQTTSRVSLPEGSEDCFNPVISADGRYVAFQTASALAGDDFNGVADIYVRDLFTATTTRVSLTSSGGEANDDCVNPSISANGGLVAYESTATNIVPGDINNFSDVFVVSWISPFPIIDRISVEDPTNPDGDLDVVNPENASTNPRITPDGRFVVFLSLADDLVTGDSNGIALVNDVFVRDRSLGTTVRASVSSQGGETGRSCSEPSISADGRWVVFTSEAPDLVQGDTNSTSDIFLRDLVLGTTIRVSLATYGVQSADFFPNSTGSVTTDGRFVAFSSSAPNLAPNDTNGLQDIFIRGPMY